MFAAPLDLADGEFLIQSIRVGAFLVRIRSISDPVKLRFAHKVTELFKFLFRLSWKPDDKGGAQGKAGYFSPHLRDRAQKYIRSASTLHAL